ncbi:transmembrane sensor [Parabacteroides sp. PF5-5]|uniref:FecR family protein n=1 Tax=unclassified Parabacteroides TaxID=2649774 RepID=UPI002476B4F5|nr:MULTISPECIES: FecR family protein [unclassified Parabacteroides]MDH6304733.1 transmembrane sensor [Parabacteroides sp. PH5-39]MDH6315652.1 transmembrane sensor [Parabacteroides sp. PF5-13]MDH6319313.1 transmembrane sensor [Parabacteroides sp. PH5-13]MDH6323044.1 transmembrane sensor [Parabacteroides sp. PH5-8]MDH6326845.1 transmembrane sensor [Parabacteroides sp. PH5-41]
MNKHIKLLDKFYEDKATVNDKRQLAGMLNNPDIWEDDFEEIWNSSFGQIPESSDERVYNAICKAVHPKKKMTRRILMRVASCAAIVGVGVVALFFWNENRLLTKYSDMIVEVGQGQKSDILLPDGTKVHLNADSQLRYGSRFNGKQRQVELIGEAYFEVAKDSQSPFVVNAGDIQIQALGTSFNIQAYPAEDIQTYLSEGSVLVSSPHESFYLQPGEVAMYSPSGIQMAKKKVEDDRLFIAWMNDEMVFDDEPVLNIIRLLERNYNVKFEVRSEKLKDITFTGTLKNASLQSTLYALQFTSSITYKKRNDVIELSSD